MRGAEDLLERDPELQRLADLSETARRGRGAVAVIAGPAGIGKTALLHHAIQVECARGMRVLTARSGELERDYTFGVVRQLFASGLADLTAPEREELLADAGEPTRRLLDEHETSGPGAIVTDLSFAVLRSLHRLLRRMGEQTPLLLAVDDLHWCDVASLRWLAYVEPRLADLPALVIGTARVDEPDSPPELAALLRVAAMTPLPELSLPAVGALVSARLGAADAHGAFVLACHTATRGNPMLLRDLLCELRALGVVPDAASAGRVAEVGPRGLSRAVLARLARLSDDAVAVATVVSILETGADLRLVAELAEIPAARARAAADLLAAAGIFEPWLPLSFVHPILRAAVAGDIGPARRATLHAAAANRLSARGEPAERVAAHLLACEPQGDTEAVATLRAAAADAMAIGAPQSAVRYLQRALAEPPDERSRGALLAELGTAEGCVFSTEPKAAIEHLEAALAEPLEPGSRVRAARVLGSVLLAADRGEEAARALSTALDSLGHVPLESLSPIIADLGVIAMADPHAQRIARPHLARIAPALVDPATQAGRHAAALAACGAVTYGGEAGAAIALARTAVGDGVLLQDETSEALAYFLAPCALVLADAAGEARALLTTALAKAESTGSARANAILHAVRAAASLRLGALPEAEADARAALVLSHENGLHLGVPFAAITLIDVLLARGDADAAVTTLAVAMARPTASIWRAVLHLSAGRVALSRRRAAEAADHARHARDALAVWRLLDWPVVPWRSLLAEAVHAGAPPAVDSTETDAAALIDVDLDNARRFGAPRLIGAALLTRGRVTGAVSDLELALETLRDSPARLEVARAEAALGAARRRAGEITAARELLRAGLDHARACGATAVAAEAHTELEATGIRPRKMLTGGEGALTPSEHRVALLATTGMSNRAIADELVVTTRTVETHLGHVYRKLGIRGRRDLAGVLAQPGNDP